MNGARQIAMIARFIVSLLFMPIAAAILCFLICLSLGIAPHLFGFASADSLFTSLLLAFGSAGALICALDTITAEEQGKRLWSIWDMLGFAIFGCGPVSYWQTDSVAWGCQLMKIGVLMQFTEPAVRSFAFASILARILFSGHDVERDGMTDAKIVSDKLNPYTPPRCSDL